MGAGRAEPVTGIVARIARVAEPAHLVELMAGRARDRPIGAGPERPIDELGERVARVRRAVGEVLGDQLPAVVIGRLDVGVGALEERDGRPVPVPVAVVPERLAREQRRLRQQRLGRLRGRGQGADDEHHDSIMFRAHFESCAAGHPWRSWRVIPPESSQRVLYASAEPIRASAKARKIRRILLALAAPPGQDGGLPRVPECVTLPRRVRMPGSVLTAKAVFDRAHEIESRTERQAYLDQACGDAPELRACVEALLRAYDEAGSFLDLPADPSAPTGHYEASADRAKQTPAPDAETEAPAAPPASAGAPGPGMQIGPYRLIRELGAGGMGAVYLAEQDTPIRRQVALKIIKPGMDSDGIVARFEAERQALTRMEHPNIAQVFDAGTTDNGRPYFVMELVKG